jgi:hypothetical protein
VGPSRPTETQEAHDSCVNLAFLSLTCLICKTGRINQDSYVKALAVSMTYSKGSIMAILRKNGGSRIWGLFSNYKYCRDPQ